MTDTEKITEQFDEEDLFQFAQMLWDNRKDAPQYAVAATVIEALLERATTQRSWRPPYQRGITLEEYRTVQSRLQGLNPDVKPTREFCYHCKTWNEDARPLAKKNIWVCDNCNRKNEFSEKRSVYPD